MQLKLHPAAMNYSTTERELLGFCVNISHFICLLTKVDFHCTVGHLT